jgi:SAM-dependent methyltransferase
MRQYRAPLPSMAPVRRPPVPAPDAERASSPRAFGQETDNAAKYEHAGKVESRLLSRFRSRLRAELQPLAPREVLDAGCGEGHVTAWLADALPESDITGVDGRTEALAAFRARNPALHAVEGDITAMPFRDAAFELVVCTEVLEHLPRPREALREIARVCSDHLFLTVPHEPFFRAGNLARGRYLARLGSTPGHVSTWNRRGFLRLVDSEVAPIRWMSIFPWQAVLAKPRSRQL